MLKGLVVFCLIALWHIANILGSEVATNETSNTVPNYNATNDNSLKKLASQYHYTYCVYLYDQYPASCEDGCRHNARRCTYYLYKAFAHNQNVCVYSACGNITDSQCTNYDSDDCLKSSSDKIIVSKKSPDEIIRVYYKLRNTNDYIN